jgi:gluconate 2-dehydrogenase gamma chain
MIDAMNADRRAVLAQLALLLGVAALPAEALAAPRRRARRFLPAPRFALLAAVSDTLMPATDTPGALAAKVPERFDALLTGWASARTREEIVGGLAAIDAAAVAAQGKSFVALAADQRNAVLKAHDAAALKPVPRRDKLTGLAALMGAPSVADPGYHRIKSLVFALYYNSEVAMTQELVYEHVPGQWVPSLKITPGMRPFAGGGLGG